MNIVYALLFITSCVALLALLALAADATLVGRGQPSRPPHSPALPPQSTTHATDNAAPDLNHAGELARYLEGVRADAESQPY